MGFWLTGDNAFNSGEQGYKCHNWDERGNSDTIGNMEHKKIFIIHIVGNRGPAPAHPLLPPPRFLYFFSILSISN